MILYKGRYNCLQLKYKSRSYIKTSKKENFNEHWKFNIVIVDFINTL